MTNTTNTWPAPDPDTETSPECDRWARICAHDDDAINPSNDDPSMRG